MSERLWRIGEEELACIKDAIESGLLGYMNERLEQEFATTFDTKYAIGVNSGTSALHSCLAAMRVGSGDEVIVPPLTFASPAFAVLLQGAVPVFADIDPDTFNIDPNEIERKVTPKTKAIIPVSLYGLSADMDPIMGIAEMHDLFVLEDCAECYLGKYKGRLAGTIGDMAIFSFERSKHMTTGNGGMIITNDAELAERARKFSVLGYSTLRAKASESKPPKEVIQDPEFERHLFVGPNYRLPEICAAMALAQLKKLEAFVEMRRQIANEYGAAVKDCCWLKPQKVPEGCVHSYWTYAMELKPEAEGISWQHFREAYLHEGGDAFYSAWKVNYLEPALNGLEFLRRNVKYQPGLCPVAEEIQPRLVQLKTNYQHIEYAKEQASALERTIERIDSARM